MKVTESGSELVRFMLDKCVARQSQKELAAILQMSPQALNNKLQRDTFTFSEMVHIAKRLGFHLKIGGKMRSDIDKI